MSSTRQMRSKPARGAFGAGLATVVAASAAPYGYTVSIWSSGAVLIHRHGLPDVLDVFLFVVGALGGFAMLGAAARAVLARAEPVGSDTDRVLAGMLQWFAVGAAVGSAALVAEVPGRVAWALGSFAATALYLLGAGVQLALVARHGTGDAPP